METKDLIDKYFKENKTFVRINLRICDVNLIHKKSTNKQKFKKALVIKEKILAQKKKCENFKPSKLKFSVTMIPFFDINYDLILEYLTKKEENKKKYSDHMKLTILHKNINLFENLFGFQFKDPKSLTQINN